MKSVIAAVALAAGASALSVVTYHQPGPLPIADAAHIDQEDADAVHIQPFAPMLQGRPTRPDHHSSSLGDLLVRLGLMDKHHPALHRPHVSFGPNMDKMKQEAEKHMVMVSPLMGGPDKIKGQMEQWKEWSAKAGWEKGRDHDHHHHAHHIAHSHVDSTDGQPAREFRLVAMQSDDHSHPPHHPHGYPVPPFGFNYRTFDRPHEHHHHHHSGMRMWRYRSRSFLHRLHRALLALNPTEALIMAFVLGAGVGAVVHAVGVMVYLFVRRFRTKGKDRRARRCARRARREQMYRDRLVQNEVVQEKKGMIIESVDGDLPSYSASEEHY